MNRLPTLLGKGVVVLVQATKMVTDKSQKHCEKFDFGYIVQQAWNPKTGEVRRRRGQKFQAGDSKLEQHVINKP